MSTASSTANTNDGGPNSSADATIQGRKGGTASGEEATLAATNNVSRAPEEESQSEIPGDPRPPHALQPPTKEEY